MKRRPIEPHDRTRSDAAKRAAIQRKQTRRTELRLYRLLTRGA